MSRRRFALLSLAAVIVIVVALYSTARRNRPSDPRGAALAPYLAGELDTVTEFTLRKGGEKAALTLHKGAEWTAAERGDYPADVTKLRKLLLALSDAKIIEQKTSNPANFGVIGVDDPSAPHSTGIELSFNAKDGKHAIILGKAAGAGNFARRGGENQSFIIEPEIYVETDPRNWIEPKLLDIQPGTIQSIEMKPAAGAAYSVHRLTPDKGDFAIDGVPPGRKALDGQSLAPSPTTYSNLTADDVAPVSEVDFSKPTVASVTLADGGVVTLTGAAAGDKRWVQIKSSKDQHLTERAAGRAFEISSYRYDAIFRPLDKLLVPIEPPASAKKSPPTPAARALPLKGQ